MKASNDCFYSVKTNGLMMSIGTCGVLKSVAKLANDGGL